LGEVYRKIRNAFVGTATPYYVEAGHFYLESNNIKNGQLNFESRVFINDEFYYRQQDNWLREGDLVMVQSGHVGHTAVIPVDLDRTAAHAVIIISRAETEQNPHFYNYQFQNGAVISRIAQITTGNTIRHILASAMKDFEVSTPVLREQTRISEFFRTLDGLIAANQRKANLLQQLKRGYLQKLFPDQGESVPRLRFRLSSCNDGSWVGHKFGEVLELRKEVGDPTEFTIDVELENLVTDAGVLIGDTSVRTLSSSIFRCGDTLFGRLRPYLNKWWHADQDGVKSGEIWAIRSSALDPLFAYFLVQTVGFLSASNLSTGSKMPRADWASVAESITYVPTVTEEQAHIGKFFRALDALIAAQQCRVTQLETLKRAYLQKMFV